MYVLLTVRLHERVQFAIGDAVKHPSVGADVLNRFRQLDPHLRIEFRDDHIVFNRALRPAIPAAREPAKRIRIMIRLSNIPNDLLQLLIAASA